MSNATKNAVFVAHKTKSQTISAEVAQILKLILTNLFSVTFYQVYLFETLMLSERVIAECDIVVYVRSQE